ncbi:MAG: hypothetical protein KKC75_02640 [Nanoarchaeota archaeon]|nr:hypothetical protein [Nanoarchaeota archaeon]MBU1005950.1 hypothetical protein [Nanoarchaeota archaeon]MBU1946158.1 hypothetical protein [Nanoarchaeota archaeon]
MTNATANESSNIGAISAFFGLKGTKTVDAPQVVDQLIRTVMASGTPDEHRDLGETLRWADDNLPDQWQCRGLRSLQGREVPGSLADHYGISSYPDVLKGYQG